MSDYTALAQRVSMSAAGIRGCLLLSRDGLVLGAAPDGDVEEYVRGAWLRFASIGEPDRSYVEFPDQLWAFVRRGGYAAFAVAEPDVRPGVLVDLLDQALAAAEQERAHDRETLRLPEAPVAPSGKPRTSLHRGERAPAPEPAPVVAEAASEEATAEAEPEPVEQPVEVEPAELAQGDEPSPEPEPEPAATGEEDDGRSAEDVPARPDAEDAEVDRILLAKEFAGLLQVSKEDDEASR
jgi:hypothetical protein